eukprot:GHVN01063621.1.p1 GENE.GHVN01063621.1~~GHVN01063621.1.p1  ORF type:complete len:279 (+),score=4.39 GHVN01063621.1:123-959(+)
MSNIHGLGDYEREPSRGGGAPQYGQSMVLGTSPDNIRCIDMFFPGFTWKAFILWISVVQALMFVVSCIVGSVELIPTPSALKLLGASYGPCVQVGQVWRFVTPIFLHGSIFHLMFNVFYQMRLGFPLEQQFGYWRCILLYFASGIAGNCLSMAWAPCSPAVGASTSVFGYIGLMFASMALHWHAIQNREAMIFNVIMFAVVTIMFSIAPGSNIDWRGHMGGCLGGAFIGVLMHHNMDNKPSWFQLAFTMSIGLLAGLYVSCIAVIFAIPMSSRGCSPC